MDRRKKECQKRRDI